MAGWAASSGSGRARWSGCSVRRRRDRGSAETWAGSSATRRISSRVSAGHQSGQYSATATWAPSISIASCQASSAIPASSRHSGAILLAPIAKAIFSSCAARASAPAKYPASARSATRPEARAAAGRAARARRSRSGAVARGSSVPSPRSPASTISVSAQAATCGRPTRCPWWL